MTEVETKIAAAIAELERLLLPLSTTQEADREARFALDTLRVALVNAVGRRVIKGSK